MLALIPDVKKKYQFYETPAEVADRVASYIPETAVSILEPSAGQGALVRAINRKSPYAKIHAVEIQKENCALFDGKVAHLMRGDFLVMDEERKFDCIVANPPFRYNADVDHFRKMYELCKPGGRIICIMSRHWQFCMNLKELKFRVWLDKFKPEIIQLPEGWAKKSGTMSSACIVVLDKPEEG
jgi:predicted RNA methylase